MLQMYGIEKCTTVQKARAYLEKHKMDYQFHDFKKEAPTAALLNTWFAQIGWEKLLNRQGLTWKRLPAERREAINQKVALELMLENPSIIKRPVLIKGSNITLGFDETVYSTFLG